MAGIPCKICTRKINRFDDKLMCIGTCKSVYHPSCVNITVAEYTDMKHNGTISIWLCPTCTQQNAGAWNLKEENHCFTQLAFILGNMLEENIKLRNSIEDNSNKIDALLTRFSMLEEKNWTLKKENMELKMKLVDQEQYSRWNCIEIHGLPETPNENIEAEVIRIGHALGIEVIPEMLDNCHRLGCNNATSPVTRDIIVKFVRNFDKMNFLRCSKIKRNLNTRDLGLQTAQQHVHYISVEMDSSCESSRSSKRNSKENETNEDLFVEDSFLVDDSLDRSLQSLSISKQDCAESDEVDSVHSPESCNDSLKSVETSNSSNLEHNVHSDLETLEKANEIIESSDNESLELDKYSQKFPSVLSRTVSDFSDENEATKAGDLINENLINNSHEKKSTTITSPVHSETKKQNTFTELAQSNNIAKELSEDSGSTAETCMNNYSFTKIRNQDLSNSDSDEEILPVTTPAKSKRRPRTIQSDSEDEIILVPSAESSVVNTVIDVSSEEEDFGKNKAELNKRLNQTILKQTTLDSMVQRRSSPPVISPQITSITKPSHITGEQNDVIYCTQKEYTVQSTKVSSLRTDVRRVKLLQSTINKENLPDKGANLTQRLISLEVALKKEEDKLNKMSVENKDLTDVKPYVAVPWEQLQAGAAAVVPRTWGKQAMATHTLQKTVTMEGLKDLHTSLATCPGEDTMTEDPKYLKVDLMPHQKKALAWLMWREKQKPSGGILADDMGLGKTLTMISLILKSNEEKYEIEENEENEKENSPENEWSKKGKSNLFDGGTLIICPASLMKQWEGEVISKCKRGVLNVEIYHGTGRESKPNRLAKQDMIITTYMLAMKEFAKKGPLFHIKWRRIILDEAHAIRNYKSQTSVAMCGLRGKSRWVLTGTPIHNTETDLYALLKFLRCTPFDDLGIWKRWVGNKNAGGQDRLNTVIKSIMLRRTKEQLKTEGALQSLPEKKFELIEVKLDKDETQIYQKVLIFSRTLFAQFLHQRAEKNTDLAYDSQSMRPNFMKQNDPNGEYYKMHKKILRMHGAQEVKSHEILVLLLRLRQICCHPSLIVTMLEKGTFDDDGIEEDGVDIDILDKLNNLDLNDEDAFDPNVQNNNPDEKENFSTAARRVLNVNNPIFNENRPNGKINKILEIIKNKVIPNGDKAIVVSQWTSMLRVVCRHLKEANICCDMLDGSVPVLKRNEIVQNFNDGTHHLKILLLSLTAGGVGLNLIGGNHLILLDLHWNPQLESQAQDRIYRVGQKKPVIIYKFVTLDTIEERIKALQDNKLQMATDILSGTKAQHRSKLTIEDLKMLFSV